MMGTALAQRIIIASRKCLRDYGGWNALVFACVRTELTFIINTLRIQRAFKPILTPARRFVFRELPTHYQLSDAFQTLESKN
ncbi:hypothetical protein CEXT_543331 [Caerostris extrusa]|uniref:Uncharacterized protein n=1 Tax=Caerostris extrusa TaxID=172846 RepID=A0AAV4VNP8_CAEEX|nr:hypothetical protein CEXT_543331 [Caerostris extrusa]